MYPKVSYTRPDQDEPTVVDCLAADVMLSNRLCNNSPKLVDLCTVVAYMAEHDVEPVKMDQVSKWARKEKIWAEQGETPDPTQSGPLSD
jgi:hypothetical protein